MYQELKMDTNITPSENFLEIVGDWPKDIEQVARRDSKSEPENPVHVKAENTTGNEQGKRRGQQF